MEGTFADPICGLSRYLPPDYQGCDAIKDKRDSLCDRVNFRDLTRVQEGVCGTTVGGADIESENKLSRGAVVRGAVHS